MIVWVTILAVFFFGGALGFIFCKSRKPENSQQKALKRRKNQIGQIKNMANTAIKDARATYGKKAFGLQVDQEALKKGHIRVVDVKHEDVDNVVHIVIPAIPYDDIHVERFRGSFQEAISVYMKRLGEH